MIWTFFKSIMVITIRKLFIMNITGHYVQIAAVPWIVMAPDLLNQTNGRKYVKKTIHLSRNVEKNTFHQLRKFHEKRYSNYTPSNLRKITRIRVYWIFILPKKVRIYRTRKNGIKLNRQTVLLSRINIILIHSSQKKKKTSNNSWKNVK